MYDESISQVENTNEELRHSAAHLADNRYTNNLAGLRTSIVSCIKRVILTRSSNSSIEGMLQLAVSFIQQVQRQVSEMSG